MKSYSCDSRESRFIFTAKLIKSSLCSSFFIQLTLFEQKKYLKQLIQVKPVLFYYTFLMSGRIYSLYVQTRQLDTQCNTCAQWLNCIICPSLIFCLQRLWATIFIASSVPIEILDAIISSHIFHSSSGYSTPQFLTLLTGFILNLTAGQG